MPGEVFPAKLPKFVKMASGTILYPDRKWRKKFQIGGTTFEDSDRRGLFVTVATEHNVAKVKCLMKEDPGITENEIRNKFNL